MKQIFLSILGIVLFSCHQQEINEAKILSAESKKIESINVERKKLNDRISLRNQRNIFKDLSGKHQLKFTSDETSAFFGTANFKKLDRDFYTLTGNAKSGNNTLTISGNVKKVSEKHLNFEGEITQKINGKIYKRTQKTTFFDENKGNFWRLQNKVNEEGFVDYIDIYF